MSYRIGAWSLALCCLMTLSLRAGAQISTAKNYSSVPKEVSGKKEAAKSRRSTTLAEQERLAAVSILTSLAEESEGYRDRAVRVRTQARVADALWDTDETLARDLFLRAWQTAEEVDVANDQNAEDARRKALSNRDGGIVLLPPVANLRSEVLRLAARRDPALGGNLIARLEQATEPENSAIEGGNRPQSLFDPTEPKLVIAKRLEVARQLLEGGDINQAKEFASPALGYATSQGLIFLCALRQKDALSADELYAGLLTRAGSDPKSDATTVSLLSSYLFTPNLLVTATQRGRISNQFSDNVVSRDFAPALRTNFFDVAARILLRRGPAELDRTTAGLAGTYFTIARLLPLFEKSAGNYLPALTAQLTLLAPDAPETFRNGEEEMLRTGLTPTRSELDALPEILNQLASASTTADRDTIYVKAIRAGAITGDKRIRDFAEKIDSVSLKERARSFTALALVRVAIQKKDAEAALRTITDGYLLPLHRVWAMAEVARLLKGSDPDRAQQVVYDAVIEANRLGIGDVDRVYALVSVAIPMFELDHGRWWNVVSDSIKAANAVPGFTGEEGRLTASLRARDVIATINANESSFRMVKAFELLAKDDLQMALSMANNLLGEAARSNANLAIARSVLERQKPSTSTMRK